MKEEQLKVLLEALPLIAMVSGGYATIVDRSGKMLINYDQSGGEVYGFSGQVHDLALKCLAEGRALMGPAQYDQNCTAWAIPFEDYVIVNTDTQRIKNEENLKAALTKAMPLIARFVGGRVSLCDKDGHRVIACDPEGNILRLNDASEEARRAIANKEPIFGASAVDPSAQVVYIPLSGDCCLAINNELTAKKSIRLLEEVKNLRQTRYSFEEIVGESPVMRQTIEYARKIVMSRSTVLIYGETGTGKEVFAQAIHNGGARKGKPFVALNCAALPASLIESQLFGHVDGAFTGAKKGGAAGYFEQADGGTIFLDEISEMSIHLQSKLLRVLQEREVTRIGGDVPIKISVRIIASTNKDLMELVKKNRFREDLYYRLNVIRLNIPSLRERKEDIAALVHHFVHKHNLHTGKFVEDVDPVALELLENQPWPGNVRELENCVEYAINIVEPASRLLQPRHLPANCCAGRATAIRADKKARIVGKMGLEDQLDQVEKEILREELEACKYKTSVVAENLGLSVTTLWRKLKKHQLN